MEKRIVHLPKVLFEWRGLSDAQDNCNSRGAPYKRIIYTYVYIYIYTHIYIYMHICVCVFILYVYVYASHVDI